MAASASALMDLVRSHVNQTALSDTVLLAMISNVHRIFQRRYPIPADELSTTIAVATATGALQTFALPASSKAMLAVYHTKSSGLELIEHAPESLFNLIDEYSGATSAATPVCWTEYGYTGYLFPTLSSAITLTVFYESMLATDFAANSGFTALVLNVPEALEYGATAEYFDDLGEHDKAKVWWAKADRAFNSYLGAQRARREMPTEPTPVTPGTIRRRRSALTRGYTWW